MDEIIDIVQGMKPITLDEMSAVKLMNRIDTKYVVTEGQLRAILLGIRDSYYVQEVEGNRFSPYNTVYYDTPELTMYIIHHDRHLVRDKVRVRTYVDSHLTFCEVKHKNNKGRTKKKRVEVPSQEIEVQGANGEFVESLVHQGLNEMHPTVRNQFHRITLVNYDKTERLTIDYDVHFHNIETGKDAETGPLVIIELKRDGNVYSPVLEILRVLRIKPSGFSKYCIGSVMTNKNLKQNIFKAKMVTLSKLANTQLN